MAKIFMGIAFSLFLSFGYSQIVPLRNANGLTYDFIDTKTKKIISKYSYDQAAPFSEGMARVNRNGLFGYINTNGDEIIPCKYIHANDFSEGFASVSIGTQVINENYVWVKDEKYGVIDISGKKIIPFEFGKIESFKDGIAKALENNKYQWSRSWGWLDKNGKWIIESKYQIFGDFNDLGMAKVGISYDSVGYINKKGVFVVDPIYYHLGDFIDGIALATKKEKNEEGILKWKSGFIDSKGETIIPFAYEQALPFVDGLAKVSKGTKWGYIDKSGRVQISLKYNYISDFNNGHAWVNENGFWGTINKKGNYELPASFDFIIEGIAPDKVLVDIDGLWGMYDYSGKEIIPIKFEQITSNDSVVFYGTIGNIHYLYDVRGNLLSKRNDLNWPDSYKEIEETEKISTMNQKPEKGGYKIDSVYNFFRIVRKNKNFGIEDYQNNFIVNPVYDSIKTIGREDYYLTNLNQKVGLLTCFQSKRIDLCAIQEQNTLNSSIYSNIIKTDYDVIHNIHYWNSNHFIRVGKNGKFGLIKLFHNKIQEIIALSFDDIGYVYKDSFVFIKKSNLWGLLNIKSNSMIFDYQFDNIKELDYGYALCKNGKWALLNQDFIISSPFIYENISPFRDQTLENNNYFLFNGKWGVINQQGEEIVRPLITKIITTPNHSNNHKGIYKISKQAFKIEGFCSFFNSPGIFLKQ